MKATIDFDEQLYRRLKIEAARRGRTIRELVAEAVRNALDAPPPRATDSATTPAAWQPAWLGSLERFARRTDEHSMTSVRASVAQARRKGGRL